jgi:hypothetical protein
MSTKIFYSNNTRDTGMIGMVKYGNNDAFKKTIEASVRNPANYSHVASFDDSARDHDDIWQALQAEVSPIPRLLMKRSMMVGDILINDTGDIFIVDSCGFRRLEAVDLNGFLTKVWGAPVFSAPAR